MPLVERKELSGHTGRSGTTIHGWPAFCFGLIFMGIGIGVGILAWSGVGKKNAPDEIIAGCCAIFFFAGLSVSVHGVRGLLARRRSRSLKDPVLSDYPWVRTHATDNAFSKGLKGLIGFGFFALFMVPFNWWAFLSDDGVIFVKLIVGVFDLILLAVLGNCVYLMLRGLKYGTSILRFDDFPFSLGKRLSARFESPRKIESNIEVTLRYVEEAYETRGTGKNRRQVVACYQIYSDIQHIPGPTNRFPIVFDLPAAKYSTCLSAKPSRYWEIEVKAETPGIDFAATFLVPVY